MARTRRDSEGSLELLLDTITNTFGSVLFITMLVAILVRAAGQPAKNKEPVSAISRANAEARVAEASAEIERVKRAIESLPPADPVLDSIEREIAELREETARLLMDGSALSARIMADQEKRLELDRRIAEARRSLERLRPIAKEQAERRRKAEERSAELAQSAIAIDKPVDPTQIVQVATFPELAETTKEQFGLLMKYGRLYAMHARDAAGNRLGPNPDHFVVTRRPDGRQTAQARPDAGHIADGATVREALRQLLSRYPADRWVIAMVVHEDSFGQFQTVKAALVELGYQYDPMTIRANKGVWDSGGTEARGQ